MSSTVEPRTAASSLAPEGVRKRLIHGFGATALGPAVTIFVQVVSVPVLLHAWGIAVYGEWLILSALPTYLALSDVGFGSVAANDMTMLAAKGDRSGALETFQSTWLLISLSSLFFGALVLSALYIVPLRRLLNISSLSLADVRLILVLFSIYALLSLQATLIMAGFRCEGSYALGTLLNNLLRLIETAAAISVALFRGSPVQVAAVYFVIRIAGTILMGLLMLQRIPWLAYGCEHATKECTRRLVSPAVAFMAFPAGNALSIQGMVVVVGIALGPIAVATFSTMRTLTRVGFQIMEAIKNSVWPELSAAYGAHNFALARRLHRTACQASLWLSLASVGFLYFTGSRIITIWTHGRVITDERAFHWLLLVIVANGLWYTSSVVTIASNKHQRLAFFYLGGMMLSLVVAWLLLPRLGITGAAVALLLIDIVVGRYAVIQSFTALSESAAEFWKSMVRMPQFLNPEPSQK